MLALTCAPFVLFCLSTMCVTPINSSPAKDCLPGCQCKVGNVEPFGELLSVTCYDLQEVPDLTVLRDIKMGKSLRLEENLLTSVSETDFPAGLNITILNLSKNKDLRIADNAFINLGVSLKVLKIENIGLAFNRTLEMFDPLFSLQELWLSYNNKHPYVKGAVQDIDTPLLQGEVAKSLTKLKIAFCGIKTLSATSLDNLKKLQELELSNNWFTAVPKVIKSLPSLTFLELFYCGIESIKDYDFSTLTQLTALDLSSNQNLNLIEPRAFAGCDASLETLVLSRCNITTFPSPALKTMKKLKKLDVSENQYTSIDPGSLEGDYQLTELSIGAPELQFNPDMFQGQEDNIITLNIVRMGLKSIPLAPIKKLTKLKRLSLAYNELTVLPERAFEGVQATTLYLSNNPLSEIDPLAFEGLSSDMVINLRNTEMDDIDFLLGYADSAIETVDLDNSKLVCRCSMKSSLNATLNIRVYGSCSKGTKYIPISSTRLEGILDQACEEERAAANAGSRIANQVFDGRWMSIRTFTIGVAWVVSAHFLNDIWL